MATLEERLKEMGLWERYEEIKEKTPEEREAIIKAGTPKPDQVFADQLKETGELKIPEPVTKEPDMVGMNGYWKRRTAELETEATEREKRLEEERKRIETVTAEKRKFWEARPTREEKAEKTWEELGIEPPEYFAARKADIGEMEGMMLEYDKRLAARDTAIARNEAIPGRGIDLMTKESKRIANNYNIELSLMSSQIKTKAAIMEMKQGNFNTARAFVREAISDYTYDLNLAYTQYETFREENKEVLDDLEEEYKDALQDAETAAFKLYTETKEEKEKVMNLMLDNKDAGITIEDTLEEAVEKVVAVPEVPGVPKLLSVAEAKSLGVPYGTTRAQAAAMGITPVGVGEVISQATLNKLAVAGVPSDVATDIQGYLNAGYDYKTILGSMIESLGKEKAVDYLESFYGVMSQQGILQIGIPQIREIPKFKTMAEELEPTEEPAEEESWWGRTKRWWSGVEALIWEK